MPNRAYLYRSGYWSGKPDHYSSIASNSSCSHIAHAQLRARYWRELSDLLEGHELGRKTRLSQKAQRKHLKLGRKARVGKNKTKLSLPGIMISSLQISNPKNNCYIALFTAILIHVSLSTSVSGCLQVIKSPVSVYHMV